MDTRTQQTQASQSTARMQYGVKLTLLIDASPQAPPKTEIGVENDIAAFLRATLPLGHSEDLPSPRNATMSPFTSPMTSPSKSPSRGRRGACLARLDKSTVAYNAHRQLIVLHRFRHRQEA